MDYQGEEEMSNRMMVITCCADCKFCVPDRDPDGDGYICEKTKKRLRRGLIGHAVDNHCELPEVFGIGGI